LILKSQRCAGDLNELDAISLAELGQQLGLRRETPTALLEHRHPQD